jgi:hypothetical protein
LNIEIPALASTNRGVDASGIFCPLIFDPLHILFLYLIYLLFRVFSQLSSDADFDAGTDFAFFFD